MNKELFIKEPNDTDIGGTFMKSCEEHIETVIDMYVDEEELAPEIRKIEHTHSLSTTCELCDKPAVYIVGNE